jgi:flagellar biosynthesis component FlhA
MKKVSNTLTKDHISIKNLISEFETIKGEGEKLAKFQEIQGKIQKHLFQEEKVVITYHNHIGSINDKFIKALMKQHDKILADFKILETSVKNNTEIDTIKLQNDLEKHIDFEVKGFYHKLDKILDEGQKIQIIKAIEDVNALNSYPFESIRQYWLEKIEE